MKITALIFTMMIFSCSLLASEGGGGVIVGNGAGGVENQIQLAYQNASSLIRNCLMSTQCPLDGAQQIMARRISEITLKNQNKTDRIIFLSEKQNPGFFTTGQNEKNRLAKTSLDPDHPIYFNTDQLYKSSGAPALDSAEIISVLMHELGHQSGEKDHNALDIFGARLANFFSAHSDSYNLEMEEFKISFRVSNFEYPTKSTGLWFYLKEGTVKDLTSVLYSSVECPYDSESFSGIEVSNGHFAFDVKNNLSFKAWAKVICYERFSGETMTYRHDLTVVLDSSYGYQGLIVE